MPKRLKWLLAVAVIILLILLLTKAVAAEVELHGDTEYKFFGHFESSARDSQRIRHEAILTLEINWLLGENWRLFASPQFQLDNGHLSSRVIDELEDDNPRRPILNLKEVYVDYYGKTNIRLGKQIISWGTADLFNPTDRINPRDYSDIVEYVDDGKIGVFAVDVKHYFDKVTLEVVLVPTFTPSRLPDNEDSRWSFVPIDFPLKINDRDLPSDSLDNTQFALKASTSYKGWDFSLSFYDGIEDIPIGTFEPDFSITPIYDHIRVIGGDLETTIGPFAPHAEIGQVLTDGDAGDDYLQYVLGFLYTRQIKGRDFYLTLDYGGETVTNKGEEERIGSGLNRVFDNSLGAKVRYDWSEFTRFELKGAVNFDGDNDYFVQPQVIHEFSDNWEIAAGFDILGGASETFFGQFGENDRIFCLVKYTW